MTGSTQGFSCLAPNIILENNSKMRVSNSMHHWEAAGWHATIFFYCWYQTVVTTFLWQVGLNGQVQNFYRFTQGTTPVHLHSCVVLWQPAIMFRCQMTCGCSLHWWTLIYVSSSFSTWFSCLCSLWIHNYCSETDQPLTVVLNHWNNIYYPVGADWAHKFSQEWSIVLLLPVAA